MAVTTSLANDALNFSENLEGNAILENLRNQRNAGKFCDILLHVQGKKLPAHRSVLAASSPYFESVLKNHRVTKEEINIGWHDVKSFEMLLDYMYSGNVVIDGENVHELLKLSSHFLISKLKGYCEEYLEQFLDIDNCLSVKDLADKFNLVSLQEAALNHIRDNITQVLEQPSFLEMNIKKLELFITDPETGCDTVSLQVLLSAVAGWVKKDIPKRSLDYQKLLDVINWNDNESHETFSHIENETLYQESKLCFYLILRTLITNDIDVGKYAEDFEELRNAFEESAEVGLRPDSDVILAGASEEDEGEAIRNELLLPDSPILVEPVEMVTPGSSLGKRRGKGKAVVKEEATSERRKTRSAPEPEAVDESTPRTRKRNAKQKYSSQEWITDEPPTKRKVEPGSGSGSASTSSPAKRQRAPIVEDFESIDDIQADLDQDVEDNLEDLDLSEDEEDGDEKTPRNRMKFEGSSRIKTQSNSASLAQWREGVKCPHCIYVGHSATRLEQHLARVHEEDTTYKCRMCPFVCKWNREYYKHMKEHFVGPPYRCEDCEYTCDRIQFILSHRMRHTDERPFHCELCSFKSRTKGNLIVHMRIHTGEKPYKCQHCGRCFAMKNTLDQHLATHRDDRPFLCDTCGFTTKYQSHLLSHKRIHTGNVFHCQQQGCSYYSPRRSQLAAHMRSHLSIRSHICSTCGRGFIEKSHLIRHERIHLDEKPFKCEFCEYGSTRRDKLKEHVLKHHSGDGAAKTPYKPRKARRQNSITVTQGPEETDLQSQLIVENSSPHEIQISQASQLSEQELATANLIYEYTTTGEVSIAPARVVIQPAMGGDFSDPNQQTVVVEHQKEEGSDDDSNADRVVIQSFDGNQLEQDAEADQGIPSKRSTRSKAEVGGLSAFMALF